MRRRLGHRFQSGVVHFLDHFRVGQHSRDFLADAIADRRVDLRRRQQAEPGFDVHLFELGGFRQARHARQAGPARVGRDTVGLHLAVTNERLRQRHRQHGEIDLVAGQFGQHLRARLVGYVQHVDLGVQFHQFHADVHRGADAIRAIAELAGLALGELHQIADGGGGHGWLADQHKRGDADRCDRHELLERVVFHGVRRHLRRHGDRAGDGEQQGVAVRLGADCAQGADGAGRAWHVFDHHRLLQAVGQLRQHDARRHVDTTAGGERDDDRDRSGWIGALRDTGI